jgi:hypothetical protein
MSNWRGRSVARRDRPPCTPSRQSPGSWRKTDCVHAAPQSAPAATFAQHDPPDAPRRLLHRNRHARRRQAPGAPRGDHRATDATSYPTQTRGGADRPLRPARHRSPPTGPRSRPAAPEPAPGGPKPRKTASKPPFFGVAVRNTSKWRRGGDSNPRTRSTPVTRFPVAPVQPLRHLSRARETQRLPRRLRHRGARRC